MPRRGQRRTALRPSRGQPRGCLPQAARPRPERLSRAARLVCPAPADAGCLHDVALSWSGARGRFLRYLASSPRGTIRRRRGSGTCAKHAPGPGVLGRLRCASAQTFVAKNVMIGFASEGAWCKVGRGQSQTSVAGAAGASPLRILVRFSRKQAMSQTGNGLTPASALPQPMASRLSDSKGRRFRRGSSRP